MTEGGPRSSPTAQRVLRVGKWVDRTLLKRSPRVERALLAVAGVLFVLATVVGFANLPEGTHLAHWELLLIVAVVGAPAKLLFVTLEYLLGGRALGLRVSFQESLRISVLSSAANLLPLPGSVLVRTVGLRQAGSSYRRALGVLMAVGLIWVGAAAVFAGGLLWAGRPLLGGILTPGGVALVWAGHLVLRAFSAPEATSGLTAQIVAVELGATVAGALRIWLTVLALDIPMSFPQAAALQFAGNVATASGIFPGGLGLREALAGAMSPVVGLPASVGLVSSTIGRILDKAALLPVALYVYLRAKRGRAILEGEHPTPAETEALEASSPTET